MKGFQKLVKYSAIAFGLYLAISIIGALIGVIVGVTSGVEVLKELSGNENVELVDETRNFDELSGLNLNISSSNLTIKAEGDSYRMEAHNIPKTTKIECKNDVLEIKNVKKLKSESSITIYVPENAKLSAEVGKVIYSGQLNGESRIECGVGEVEMNLEGGIDNYSIKVQKGIGNIKINKESVNNDSTTGNGQNKIYIDGGVGDIDIKI